MEWHIQKYIFSFYVGERVHPDQKVIPFDTHMLEFIGEVKLSAVFDVDVPMLLGQITDQNVKQRFKRDWLIIQRNYSAPRINVKSSFAGQ